MGESGGNGSGARDGQRGSPDLEELRSEIEEIDDELLENIARRTYIADSIAEAKRRRGMSIDDPEREREVIDRVVERAEKLDVETESVKEVFELLIEMNKRRQRDQ